MITHQTVIISAAICLIVLCVVFVLWSIILVGKRETPKPPKRIDYDDNSQP